jgi:hypothetical protein
MGGWKSFHAKYVGLKTLCFLLGTDTKNQLNSKIIISL